MGRREQVPLHLDTLPPTLRRRGSAPSGKPGTPHPDFSA